MSYTVIIPNYILDIIEDFCDYILHNLYNYEATITLRYKLLGAIKSLDFLPTRFQKYNQKYHRMIVDKNYIIIYKINEEKKQVIIINILRTERNINFF